MLVFISAILVPQSTEHGLARTKHGNRDPYPIYEGLDNLDLIMAERGAAAQWTRVPVSNRRHVAIVPAPALPVHILPSSHVNRADEVDGERNRRRSATRVQLAIPQRTTGHANSVTVVDNQGATMPEAGISSGVTSNTNSIMHTPNDTHSRTRTGPDSSGHIEPAVRLRPTLRRAATISPVRQYRAHHEEISNSTELESQQPAMSSGFVSAGSIVAVPEDGVEAVIKSSGSVMTKSRIGELHGLPPPVDVHAYPLVCDLQRGLDRLNQCPINGSVDPNSNKRVITHTKPQSGSDVVKLSEKQVTYVSGPLQTPVSSKFLLGRVASNEDICIQTETPFAFTIAATDKEICITKVASVDDLKRLSSYAERSTDGSDVRNRRKLSQPTRRAIPVNLRLTFGSESNLAGSHKSRKPEALPPGSNYRVMYHVDIPYGSNVAQFKRDALRRTHSASGRNPFRYSLPCISYREDEPKPIALVP